MNRLTLRARLAGARRVLIGFSLILALISTAAVIAPMVAPAFAQPSYPTWAEVQAAKHKVAAKKALIARLDQIIADQNTVADRLAKISLIKGEKFNQAQGAVDVMASKVKVLQGQADAANASANAAQTQLGQLAAQMYRNGSSGTTLNLLLNASKADDLLYQLGQSEKIAQQSNTIYKKSIEKQKYAQSVTDQLKVAKSQLAGKAKIAHDAFAAATQAANAVEAQLAAFKAKSKTFYAQLASLQNTSAAIAKAREDGIAADKRQQEGTADFSAPELYTVGDADQNKVSIAINFAQAQLGEPYVLGGMGPRVWDCSGITKAAYAAAGIYIGTHSATNQFNTMAAEQKLVPLSERQVGDLFWYTQEPNNFNGDKYHVVIYLGNGEMLEAPHPGATVRIRPIRWGEMYKYAGRPSA